MIQDKYSITELEKAIEYIESDSLSLQKTGLKIVNGAMCRSFASTYNEIAVWAISNEVKNNLFKLLYESSDKNVVVNCFHAICNICCRMIEEGDVWRDIPNFSYSENCINFKNETYKYVKDFLNHKISEVRFRAADMCLYWGDAQGWDIIIKQVNLKNIDHVKMLINRTWNILFGNEGVTERYDLYGKIVPKKNIISYSQAIKLKDAIIITFEKEEYQSDYFKEQISVLLEKLNDIINETMKYNI